ncbi:MAG: hypothetical protein KIS96_01220 [Bauldia sp.]|nr:hypothetical protein [Bauldia sp.]
MSTVTIMGRDPMTDRSELIRAGVKKGVDLIMQGQFEGENPWEVVAAFAYDAAADVTMGELQEAIDDLAKTTEMIGTLLKPADEPPASTG